jgi:tetratricopeptide (TPR) repeat protein
LKPSTFLAVLIAASVAMAGSSVAQQAPGPSGSEPSPESQGAEVLRHLQRLRFDAAGRRTRTVAVEVQITSAAGLEAWGGLDLWHSPDRETATVTVLEIVKPSGERIRPKNLAMEDRRASGVFDGASFGDMVARHVTVPALSLGDRLVYEYAISARQADYGDGYAAALAFPTDQPVRDAFLELEVPTRTPPTIWTRPGLAAPVQDSVEGGRRTMRWHRHDVRPPEEPVFSLEGLLTTPADEPDPDVMVTSFGSWAAVGDWYSRILDGVKFDRAPVAARARALTAAAATDEAKLQALYRFVATDVRYVSLAFGLGRFQPRPPHLVLETGYGDCKDKHLLLAAMAREVGITVAPVLISMSDTLVSDLPSPAQFDHLISVWRRSSTPTDWLWLDSTSGLTGPGVLLPNLRGKQALLLESGAPHALVATPDTMPPEDVETVLSATLSPDGTQIATVTHRLTDDRALVYRMVGAEQWTTEQAKAAAKELLHVDGLHSSTVTSATVTSEQPPWGPLTLTYAATVKFGLASTITKKALWVSSPSLVLPDPGKLAEPWRLPLGPGGRTTVRVAYTLPEGWKVELPAAVSLTQPFGRYRSQYTLDGRIVRIERVLEMDDVTLEAAARPMYTIFRKAISDDRSREIGLREVPSPAAPAEPTTDPLYAEARAALDAGRLTQGRDLLLTLTSARPDHPHAWLELGRAYTRLSDFNLAQKAFERQITINPVDAFAYNHLALSLNSQGRRVEAEAAFRKQIEVSPFDKLAHRNLGGLLLDTGRPEEAVRMLETALSVDRQDAFTRVQLGRAYLEAKSVEKAVEAFEAATSIATPPPLILNEAAWRLVQHGTELPRARGYADRGVAAATATLGTVTLAQMAGWRLGPMGMLVRLWDTLGWIAFTQGDLVAAQPWLEAAHEFSDAGEVAWHLGQLYEKQGQKPKALVMYTRAASVLASPWRDASAAVQRLEREGVASPRDVAAAEVESRRSSVRVGGMSARQQGEIVAMIEPDGGVGEVLSAHGDVPPTLAAALKGQQVPGSAIARSRQARLFRAASVECTPAGLCTLVWHRLP